MKLQSTILLLKRLAAAWKRPEDFVETCEAWDDFSEDALKTPGFDQIVDPIFRSASEDIMNDEPIGKDSSLGSSSTIVGTFTVDPAGKITSAGPEVRSLVGMGEGDAISEFQMEMPPAAEDSGISNPAPVCLIELKSRSGARYLAHCHDSRDVSGRRSYSLLVADMSPLVEGYLRWTLKLTWAEVEITRLLLRRRSIPEISKDRDIRVNTVRTHINSINRKFSCRSITEVIASIYELSYVLPHHNHNWLETAQSIPRRQGEVLTLSLAGVSIEYLRFGDESARPLVILHSIEYGASPPDEFINEAINNGYCVYMVFRPGFGRSTPTGSIPDSAERITQALERLGLNDVTLVALSSAAPIALQMMRDGRRLGCVVVVNFLMADKDKIKFAKPAWVRGLLDLGTRSIGSFKYAARMTRGMLRLAGAARFFRSLYANQPYDLDYVETHPKQMENAAALLLGVSDENLRLDLVTSFVDAPDIEAATSFGKRFAIIFGEDAHSVPKELSAEAAAKHGLSHFVLPQSGRNCAYQKPKEFFAILESITAVTDAPSTASAA